MVSPKKDGFGNGDNPEGSDRHQEAESMEIDESDTTSRRRIAADNLTERHRDVLRDESNGDPLLDRSGIEIGIVRWLRALDLQVIGACRAGERLKPLLKLNISNGVAEDRLLDQLSQHFEASEVGMLARCLCIPLVSIRVGKVNKQGNLLCPTAARGHLDLTLLPSSNMRISFSGDDGCTERLALLNGNFDSSEVVIEEISADSSGRSFVIKVQGSQVLYFWCSEKSKLHGIELLAKMKDLLRRKPTLSHLTGIHESRLQSFATHLRTYLGSSIAPEVDPVLPTVESPTTLHTASINVNSPPLILKSSPCHFRASQISKGQSSDQQSLSPRPTTFKNETTISSLSMGSGIREKFSQHGDNSITSSLCSRTTGQCEDNSVIQPEMPVLSSSVPSPIPLLLNLPEPQIGALKPMFSPYYCWSPPSLSSIHLPLPITYNESIPLPPLSSLFSSGLPVPPVSSNLSFDVSKLPLPKPFVGLPTSQQISTFAPFMSDPIVHTPMIDVCSSGQGYIVGAGPAISSALPPLHSSFVNPLIPNKASAVEKSARETLRMLMASTPTFTSQIPTNILSPFLDKMDQFSYVPGSNHGSQGLHSDTLDFKAVAISLPSTGDEAVGKSVPRGKSETCDSVEDLTLNIPNSKACDTSKDGILE